MNKLLRQLDSCYLIVSKEEAIGAISYIQYRKKKKKSKKKRGRVVFLKFTIFFFYYPLQSMNKITSVKTDNNKAVVTIEFEMNPNAKTSPEAMLTMNKFAEYRPDLVQKFIKDCIDNIATKKNTTEKTKVDLGGITVVNPKAS